jgi:hypothetical protein
MIEEVNQKLPDLIIPKFRGESTKKEFIDGPMYILKPGNKGWLTVECSTGETFPLWQSSDILLLFKDIYNWTFSNLGEWDCIFKGLTRIQAYELSHMGVTTLGEYELSFYPGTAKLMLRKGKDYRYLINVAKFVSKNHRCNSFQDIQNIVNKLQKLNKDLGVNLISFASTTKDLLLMDASREFTIVDRFSQDDIQFLYSGYKGPRMETRTIGTIDNAETLDLRKAYLKTLAGVPTTNKNNVIIRRGDKSCSKSAHPGSTYKVRVNIPSSYNKFPPIPVRGLRGIVYPVGEFVTVVSKSYIEILEEVGDIEYEILDSFQVIVINKNGLPFEHICNMIEYYEDTFRDELYPINLKALHFTMVGHFLHYHQSIDKNSKKIIYTTSQDFNPLLSNSMQGIVAKEIWEEAMRTNANAIRVDAITGRKLKNTDRFKHQGPGTSTFLTPSLKDHPGEHFYRDLIHDNRDKDCIKISYDRRLSLAQSYFEPKNIGHTVPVDVNIPATSGSRHLDKCQVNRLGNLLEREIGTTAPDFNNPGGFLQCLDQDQPSWVEEYLRLTLTVKK